MAKIVISEFMDERAVALLQARHEVLYDPKLQQDAARLRELAASSDALIVRNLTQVRGDLLAALGQCKVVGRLGVGLDNIDVPGCEARGIEVIPATGANALSVAEYVIATAMLLLRGTYGATADVAAGKWPRVALSNGREIRGQTLGLIGFGSIGQTTARLALGLGMKVQAFDPGLAPSHPIYDQSGVSPVSLDVAVAQSDVLSLHVPLVDGTRGLLNAQRIASMKQSAILINTSRGHIVDVQALATALRAGHLGGAALDVFDAEPLLETAAFINCPNLILTPHISGLSLEANERVSFLIAEKVLEVLA
jgi:(S)-sulfolactate dehydrogenase